MSELQGSGIAPTITGVEGIPPPPPDEGEVERGLPPTQQLAALCIQLRYYTSHATHVTVRHGSGSQTAHFSCTSHLGHTVPQLNPPSRRVHVTLSD